MKPIGVGVAPVELEVARLVWVTPVCFASPAWSLFTDRV